MSLDCALAAARKPLDGECCYEIVLDGLIGGHSGADIDKGRASANPLMVRVLYSAMEQIPLLRLCDIHGGQFDNVISPSCRAKIAVPHEQAQALEQFLASFGGVLKNEWACEPGLSLSWNAAAPSDALSVRDTSRALHLLLGLPHGVQAMSMEFPGLVQTSLNFSFVCLEPDGLRFTCSIRSCIASQKAMMVQRVRAAVESAGGSVAERSDYPGWQYAKSSALRELILSAYRDISGREGRVVTSHGGLECGLFVDRIPGLDAISTGPDLQGVHSVHERVSVRSIAHLYDLVCEVLKRSR